MDGEERPAPATALVKPASGDCNLGCTYCFYHGRPGDPYRNQSHRRMSETVLDAMVSQMLSENEAGAAFCWQGGEPALMGLEFYRRAVELMAVRGRKGQTVSNAFQTNGIALDREWVRFLREWRFFVGLSIDGPAAVHDLYRRSPRGRGTHAQVMRAARLLQREGVEFNALAVVARGHIGHAAEIHRYLAGEGIYHQQYIPAYDYAPDGSGRLADYSVDADAYADFLCELFDAWYADGRPVGSVRTFENLALLLAGRRAETCLFQPSCGSYLVVEHDGGLYPCDFYVEAEWRLGSLLEGERGLLAAANSRRQDEFLAMKPAQARACAGCELAGLCKGGCPRFRKLSRRVPGAHDLCEAFRRLVRHAGERLRRLTADRLAPPPR